MRKQRRRKKPQAVRPPAAGASPAPPSHPALEPEPAPHPHEATAFWAFAALLAVVFGALSHWRVFEYDPFWEARAGEEILGGSGIQQVDTWSHTAYGSPWYNFAWLSMTAIHLATRVGGGFGALAGLRSALVALWIFQIAGLVRRGAGRGPASVLAAALLIPWIYVACSFRLQMRPDLFGANCFAAMMLVWSSDLAARTKRILGIAVLVLWANLHSGTAPFGLLAFAAFVGLSEETPLFPTLRGRAAWIAGGALTSLMTPLGYRVYRILTTVLAYDYEKTKNPDFRPFGLELLRYHEAGAMMSLWTLYAVLACVACVALFKRARVLPGSYRSRAVVAMLGAALTFMVLQRIRSIHYQVVFFVPVVSAFVGGLVRGPARAGRFGWGGIDGRFALPSLVAAGALWGLVLPDHVQNVAKPIGSGVSQLELPVASVEFLQRVHPAKNLLNAYQFGGYVVEMLRELPVSVDGRELPFERFRDEMRAAEQSPASYAAFLREHDITRCSPPSPPRPTTRSAASSTAANGSSLRPSGRRSSSTTSRWSTSAGRPSTPPSSPSTSTISSGAGCRRASAPRTRRSPT